MIFRIIIYFSLSIIMFNILYYVLNIFQQEHYSMKKTISHYPNIYIKNFYLVLYLILLLLFNYNNYHIIVIIFLSSLLVIFPTNFIIPLKITNRIKRLFLLYISIFLLLIVNIKQYAICIFTSYLLFTPLLLILYNLIVMPLEIIIAKRYIKKAKAKINDNLVIVGITGSCGKTSCKNILNQVLSHNYLTVASPKSYNTLLGITKTINENLKTNTEILILEMGATKKGDITKIVKYFPPKVSVVTEIAPQHMSTFKTIENVVEAKLEIIKNVQENVAIINGDNELLRTQKNIEEITYVGINNDNDYYASDIEIINGITTFAINSKKQKLFIVKTKLLGMHNIKNIITVYGIIQNLKKYQIIISDEIFIKEIEKLKPIPHRLEYKKLNNIHLYDDSYSSNIVGFESAISVLEQQNGKKVLITPGIVDCGKYNEQLNLEIAKKILYIFDDIYLINNRVSKIYENYFLEHKKKFYLYDNFINAYNAFKLKYRNEEVHLLIENDLPDNYLKR